MRVLVTGAAGFIGSHLCDALLADGATVRGVDAFTSYYDPACKRANVAHLSDDRGFELVESDLTSADLEGLLDGTDVVFHLGAQPGVHPSWEGFATYLDRNVLATQRLLDATRGRRIERFVFASSSSVYGNAEHFPTSEDDRPRPFSPYGVTKLAAEHLCSMYAENWGVPTISLRYFTVYGPRQRPDMAFSRFIDMVLAGRPVPRYGDGEQVRDFTFVDDVVRATLLAARQPVVPGSVCNVAGGSAASVNDIIALLGELTGRDVAVEPLPSRAGDVVRTGAAVERARAWLGWEPLVECRDGVRRQLEWTAAQRVGR